MKAKTAVQQKHPVAMGDTIIVRSRAMHAGAKAMPAIITEIVDLGPLLEDDVALAIVRVTAFPQGSQPLLLQLPVYEAEPAGAQTAGWIRS